jgi:hypothetical protein
MKVTDTIQTSAEAAENAILPMIHEVHTDPETPCTTHADLPDTMKSDTAAKSPARWAYERLILYIQNFEKQLDAGHEVALGLTGSGAGVVKIEGLGYFDPDLVTFYGSNENGQKTQLIQHVTQLNVMLIALAVESEQAEPNRIGFQLGRGIEAANPATD